MFPNGRRMIQPSLEVFSEFVAQVQGPSCTLALWLSLPHWGHRLQPLGSPEKTVLKKMKMVKLKATQRPW